jgi:hypothetical protein
MLSFKPENCPSAQQVLESEWIVEWAVPENVILGSSVGKDVHIPWL